MSNILVRFITRIMDSMSDVNDAQREDSGGPMHMTANGNCYTDYRTYEERVTKPIEEVIKEMEGSNNEN